MTNNGIIQTVFDFLASALMYTFVGTVAALLYTSFSSAFGLPGLSILTFLALWWFWLCLFAPPIILAISTFRATDPVKKLFDLGLTTSVKQPDDKSEDKQD